MSKRSYETIPAQKYGSFCLTHLNKWYKLRQITGTYCKVNHTCGFQSNVSHDVSISSIVVRNDKFKEKAAQDNENLERLCAERNIYFINHAKNILPQHLNKSKLHLNRKGSSILTSNFVKAPSHVFNWLEETSDKDSFSECEENKLKSVDASINCSILGSLRRKHLKKLIIAHLNINSLRNKFQFLADQIKGKADLLMVSETKLD